MYFCRSSKVAVYGDAARATSCWPGRDLGPRVASLRSVSIRTQVASVTRLLALILKPGYVIYSYSLNTFSSPVLCPHSPKAAPRSEMSQSTHQGVEGRNDLSMYVFLIILTYPSLISQIFTIDGRRLSSSSNQPLQEKSNLGDGSGRSPYTESMATDDAERTIIELERSLEDFGGIIAFVSPFNRGGILCA
jgi:hypothetical protein